jgi:hypothetical protein
MLRGEGGRADNETSLMAFIMVWPLLFSHFHMDEVKKLEL